MKTNVLARTRLAALLAAEIGDTNENDDAGVTREDLAAAYDEFTDALEMLALQGESLPHQIRCLYYVRTELHALQRSCYEAKKKSASV